MTLCRRKQELVPLVLLEEGALRCKGPFLAEEVDKVVTDV